MQSIVAFLLLACLASAVAFAPVARVSRVKRFSKLAMADEEQEPAAPSNNDAFNFDMNRIVRLGRSRDQV
jgi:hypothetical protein